MLSHLDMKEVYAHYRKRQAVQAELSGMFYANDAGQFVPLALGITNPLGNYSASEYHSGPSIVQSNGVQAVFDLAQKLNVCSSPTRIPDLISTSRLKYLKISVGSEMSMMLQPGRFWTANVRTVWASLLIKYGDDYKAANEELALYRASNGDSAMDYSVWAAMHPTLEIPMSRLYHLGVEEAKRQNVSYGHLQYLWADAIADMLYHLRTTKVDAHAERKVP